MAKIKIITDSTSDLTPTLYKKLGCDIARLKVNFGLESYVDGKDIDIDKLYQLVEEKQVLPKTSACSVGEIIELFEKNIKEGYEIIFVGISSLFSSNVNNARIAALSIENSDKKIRVVDSMSLSSGIGLLLFKIHEDINADLSLEEVYQNALKIIQNINAEFVVDTMEFLFKGGRCSGLSYFFGKAFKIHPVIRVENGGMVVHKLPRGRIEKGVDVQINEFKEQLEKNNVDLSNIFITHSKGGDSIQYMFDEVSKLVDPSIISITEAGCIVSSHCGKGTIGLLYITKEKVIK